MSLGDAFPAHVVQDSIKRQLQPGAVVKFVATLDDGTPHEKRFVVLNVTESTLVCVLNTDLNQIILRNANMLACQVAIAASSAFVDHDCYIDCSRIRSFPTDDVLAQLVASKHWVLGVVTRDLRDQILAALKQSRLIPMPEVRLCCASLESCDTPDGR